MSYKIRRALAVAAVLSALSLALPMPAQAANLWSWNPTDLTGRVWSWLQDLVFSLQSQKSSSGLEKEGSMVDPDGQKNPGSAPGSTTSDQGGK